jgi:hypothetical protein
VEGAGADLEVERLDQHAALRGPVGVELEDQALERDALERWSGHAMQVHGVECRARDKAG